MGGHSKLNNVFRTMKQRCCNSSCTGYKYYGGRGITVCDLWLVPRKGYQAFKLWALANGYSEGLTLDRIDVNGNYVPENCHWVPIAVQNINRRDNHFITFKGTRKTILEWSTELGINYGTLASRLNRSHMTPEVAFKKGNLRIHELTYQGKTQSISAWSKELGISYAAIKHRIKRGWSVAEALEKE